MKYRYILFILAILALPFGSSAQSFTYQHDTVQYLWPNSATGSQNVLNGINNLTPDSMVLKWHMIDTDYPSSWDTSTGVCDNATCYSFALLWPGGAYKTSNKYGPGLGDFHLQLNMGGLPSGCHYITIRAFTSPLPSDSATATFLLCKVPTVIVDPGVEAAIQAFPNPATSELTLKAEKWTGITAASICDATGRVMQRYNIDGVNAITVGIGSLPTGIYLVHFTNADGAIAATRKIEKL